MRAPGSAPGAREGRVAKDEPLPPGWAPPAFLLVVSGPSGAGKGTLVERLLAERDFCVLSVSTTTRPRRPNETQGAQYDFVDRVEFERRRAAGEFLEWAEVHDHLYGTPAGFVEQQLNRRRVVVLEVDVQGGASVRRAHAAAVSVFVYPPSVEALRERLLQRRADDPQAVERRLRNAPAELAQLGAYDYVIVNDDLDQAAARLVAIVDAERSRVARLVPQRGNRKESA